MSHGDERLTMTNQRKMLFRANLVNREGGVTKYVVEAENKTQARQKIASEYRLDHPASAGIYLPFSAMRLEWDGEPQPVRSAAWKDL